MKKAFRWLLPVMVIALLVGALCVIASAETAEPTVYFTITSNSDPTQVIEVTTNELLCNNAAGTIPTAAVTWDNVTVDLKQDVTYNQKLNILPKGNVTLNLNGHRLEMKGAGRFQIDSASSSMTVNAGTGGVIKTANNGSKFYATTSTAEYVLNNVDINAGGVFMDFRAGTITFNGCDISCPSGSLFIGGQSGANSKAYFNNCVINASGTTGAAFHFGRNWETLSTDPYGEFHFVNTKVTATTPTLFDNVNYLEAPTRKDVSCKVFIDGTSSFNAPNSTLFTASIDAYDSETVFAIAEGADINVKSVDEAIPITVPAGSVMAHYGVGSFKVVGKDTPTVNVSYYHGETLLGTKKTLVGVDVGHVFQIEYSSDLTYANGTVTRQAFASWADGDGNDVTVTSDKDISLYALIQAEEPYWVALSSDTEITEQSVLHASFDNNLSGNLKSEYTFVRLLRDSNFKGSDGLALTWNLTVDLNDKTLTLTTTSTGQYPADATFRPGNGGHLILRDGKITNTNTRVAYSSDGTNGKITIADCDVDLGYLTMIDARGGDVTLTNLNINLINNVSSTQPILDLNCASSAQTNVKYVLENINVTSNGSSKAKYVARFPKNTTTNSAIVTMEDISVADDVITDAVLYYATSYTGTLTLGGAWNTPTNIKSVNCPNATASMTVSLNGLKVKSGSHWSNCFKFNKATLPRHVIAYNGTSATPYTVALVSEAGYSTTTLTYPDGSTDTAYVMAGAKPLIPTDKGFLVGGVVVGLDAEWYENTCPVAVAGGEAEITVVYAAAPFAIYDSSGDLLYAGSTADTTIKVDPFAIVPEGGSFVLYGNLKISDHNGTEGKGIVCNNNVTIDLNGNNLDMRAPSAPLSGGGTINGMVRFNIGSKTVTVKNGSITNDYNMVYGDNNSGVITFDNVAVSVSGSTAFDMRGGTVHIVNGSVFDLTGGNSFFINAGNRGGNTFINITDSTVTSKGSFMNMNPRTGYTAAYGEVNAINSTVTFDKDILSFSGTANVSTAVLNFTDSKLSFGSNYTFTSDPKSVTVNINESFVSGIPETTAKVTVNLAQGQKAVPVDSTTYAYKITKVKLPVSANLTLFSDFNLNLFISNAVTKVTANGKELELESFDETLVKATVKEIAAASAAKDIVFAISYLDGGYTLTVDYTYSVVKYAQALLAGNYSDESKALVVSAVDYVSKAYTYAGNSNDTLAALVADESYKAILATASNYTKDTIVAGNNYSNLNVAIYSAALTLSNDYKYVVDFVDTYTGTVTVNGVSYTVVDGKVNGNSTVTVTLRGYEFNDGLTVTATTTEGTVSGTYTLADYVKAMADGNDTAFDNLLVALYNFTVEAKEYKAYVDANGGNLQ